MTACQPLAILRGHSGNKAMLHLILTQLAKEIIKMLMPEIQAQFDNLQASIDAEKLEVQEAIKATVAQAIAPLETQIVELKDALAAAQDPGEILAKLSESVEAVKSIVSAPSPEAPATI